MTFDEYINNPMGVKNAVFSHREIYRKLYNEKLDKILVREAGKVTYKLMKYKNKYYCYMNIPSEVCPNIQYDVIVEFSEPKDKKFVSGELNKYDVRFFSNDPSFVFTFCHAFIKNGMFLEDFKDKMSTQAMKKKAVEKNPKDQVGYVKSIYFLYLLMKRRALFIKTKYVDNYDQKYLLKQVMHANKKIEQRQLAEKDLKKQQKKERTQLNDNIKRSTLNKGLPNMKTTSRIGSVKSVSNIKNTKRSKVIK